MAGLNYINLTKELPRGPFQGRMALTVIAEKISTEVPFEIENGSDTILQFVSPEIRDAFNDENLTVIETWYRARREFFYNKDDVDQQFRVTQLTRTTDLGGQSGGSSPGDPHELMTAALILQYGRQGKKGIAATNWRGNRQIASLAQRAKFFAHQVEGSIPRKDDKIAIFDDKLEELAQAISAANGFLKNLSSGSRVVRVYATGQSWNEVLRRYRIRPDDSGRGGHLFFGKQDYNSSDLIVEVMNGRDPVFVGVSLKKKKISKTAADPTVLNKTVMGADGLLKSLVKQGYVNAYRDYAQLYKIRSQFWYDVIVETLTGGDNRARSQAENKLLRNQTVPQYLQNLRTYISTVRSRSQYVLNEAQKLGQTNMTKAVYSQYPEGTQVVNEYFRALNAMLTDPRHAQAIVISLANIIFKTDLQGYIKLRNRGPIPEFKFTLITGRGNWSDRGGMQIRPASELQEHFTSSIIADAMNNASGGNFYRVVQTPGKLNAYQRGATSAKIYFDIWMGTLNLANMEIRYKGKISQEPQFFATITPAFKQEYMRVRRDGGGNRRW